jgi:hypothetical protein
MSAAPCLRARRRVRLRDRLRPALVAATALAHLATTGGAFALETYKIPNGQNAYVATADFSIVEGTSDNDVIFGDPPATNGAVPEKVVRVSTGYEKLNGFPIYGTNANNDSTINDYVGNPFSPDGGGILFRSRATNLLLGFDTNSGKHVYRRALASLLDPIATPPTNADNTVLTPEGTGEGDFGSGRSVYSPDGRYVLFTSEDDGVTVTRVFPRMW